MGAKKQQSQSAKLAEIAPILKVCKIQRLTDAETLDKLAANGHEMSSRTLTTYKGLYSNNTDERFLTLARSKWADEHLLILDILETIEGKYWELYNEAETPTEGKNILDSIRATQSDKTLFYNEAPMIKSMKETLEARLEEIDKKDAGQNKKT